MDQPLKLAHDFVRKHFVRIAVFGGNFAVAKAAAFLGPLVLARALDPIVYGLVEYAWSFGQMAAAVLGVGLAAAVPQLSLLRRPIPLVDVLAATLALPGTVLLAAGLACWLLFSAPVAGLLAAAVVLALAQANLSSYSRTFSYRNWAVWLDGLAVHAIVVPALLLVAVAMATTTGIATATVFAAGFMLAASGAVAWRNWQPDFGGRLRIAVLTGLPLLAYSLCAIWAAGAPRIYLGALLSATDVAIFSVCFRVGSLILVLHVVVGTGLFARLYRMPTRLYDRYVGIYLAGIATLCGAFILAFPFGIRAIELRAIPREHLDTTIRLFPVVMLLIFGWQAWALLEMRIARVRRATQAAWRAAIWFGIIAAAIGLMAAVGGLTLPRVAWLCALQMLGGVAIQGHVLWRRGAKMPHTVTAIVAASGALAAVAWFGG